LLLKALENGKVVYYYNTCGENEKYTSGKSTGETTKAAAHAYIARLIERGELIPKKEMNFYDFVKD